MTILIEQTKLESVGQLSNKTQTLLSLIPQGEQWLQVMLNDKEHTVSFASEAAFIEEVGPGLRDTSLIYFPNLNLTVGIQALSAMSESELILLIRSDASSNNAAMNKLFSEYRLINDEAFKVLNPQLINQPLRWSSTFDENIQLYQSLSYADGQFDVSQSVKQEASEWAQEQAQTLAEFGDYYCLYLALYNDSDGNARTLNGILAQLQPVVLDNLDCPIATYELDQKALQRAIEQWQAEGNTLGFSTLSAGLLNVGLNLNLKSTESIESQAESYIASIQSVLKNQLATDSYINQSGKCRHYEYSLTDRTILLNLNAIGCLSLFSDRPKAV
ncbi:hypothetical protein [Marinomonas mediterranea]|jgi:hypothetical protein|uniref:Uncharacterized protein n=1 Tax=Marinomonas mediterranea (strain ATCC 700492 / JCM 21426 / NBRC 103028 / MMB-1) TaxID=717774 RepID=F2JYB8_MARM1|nr:hypothetical protein [Marinomonas mediterranea]ADZ91949.1 hypothetical protein Marme_2719 [Marinomonas mediterranea MMB-1]WCN09902.1 hypothetical protein GV055_13735 [Marinomonas mediterranea]WCN18032.1 hypothetical protein GV053_13750 [Marinomonas mediterranea MMB-1]